MDEANTGRWTIEVSGTTILPEDDKLTLIRHDQPRIFLEIAVPGIRSAGEDQRQMGRQAILDAIDALQAVLNSPTALPGFRPDGS